MARFSAIYGRRYCVAPGPIRPSWLRAPTAPYKLSPDARHPLHFSCLPLLLLLLLLPVVVRHVSRLDTTLSYNSRGPTLGLALSNTPKPTT